MFVDGHLLLSMVSGRSFQQRPILFETGLPALASSAFVIRVLDKLQSLQLYQYAFHQPVVGGYVRHSELV